MENRLFAIILSAITGTIAGLWFGSLGAGATIFSVLLTLAVIKTVE